MIEGFRRGAGHIVTTETARNGQAVAQSPQPLHRKGSAIGISRRPSCFSTLRRHARADAPGTAVACFRMTFIVIHESHLAQHQSSLVSLRFRQALLRYFRINTNQQARCPARESLNPSPEQALNIIDGEASVGSYQIRCFVVRDERESFHLDLLIPFVGSSRARPLSRVHLSLFR